MRSKLSALATCLVLGVGCGSHNDSSDQTPAAPLPQAKTKVSSETVANDNALEKEYSSLPASVIIAVPVDASGKEDTSKAEMRTVQASGAVDEKTVGATFATAKAPAKVGGELDGDSSTQSWANWQPGYQQYNPQQNNSNWTNIDVDYNQYNQQFNQTNINQTNIYNTNNYYNNYRPWAYSNSYVGYYWSYSRPTCYTTPVYNYYYYPRRCHHWRFCNN